MVPAAPLHPDLVERLKGIHTLLFSEEVTDGSKFDRYQLAAMIFFRMNMDNGLHTTCTIFVRRAMHALDSEPLTGEVLQLLANNLRRVQTQYPEVGSQIDIITRPIPTEVLDLYDLYSEKPAAVNIRTDWKRKVNLKRT